MTLKLYYDLLSQPSRALYILLKHANVPFEGHPMDMVKGEHLSEEFRSINRFQKVPAIDDGGFKMIESVGIIRYLAREKNLPDHWYPKDSQKQGRVDEYLEWQHINIRAKGTLYFRLKWLHPLITGEQVSAERLAKYEIFLSGSLDEMESLWLNPGPFIANNDLSVADIWAACEIEQIAVTGYEPTKGRPLLKAWLERVRNEINPYYDEAHARLKDCIANTKKISILL